MLLVDVNVLVAAHRGDHPRHGAVRPWFDSLLATGGDFCVPYPVWASFLRIATNRRIFAVPTPLASAFAFVDATIAQHGYVTLAPGRRHLALVRQLCEEADATGDLVPDAVLAAVAVEHGATVATLDRDFGRFASVHHLRPEASP